MERKIILVDALGAPKRIVQHIETRPKTATICPLCKTRFKRNAPTVLVDAVKRIRLTGKENDDPEFTIRIHLCEPCAAPLIKQKEEAFRNLVTFLARLAVDKVMRDVNKKHDKRVRPTKPERLA